MSPLFAVRDRLREQGAATASQLAAALHLPSGTVEDMLGYWQRRGRIEPVVVGAGAGCGSACRGGACAGCAAPSATDLRFYRWSDSDVPLTRAPAPRAP